PSLTARSCETVSKGPSAQPRLGAGLEVLDHQVDAAPPLPLVELGAERQAAGAAGRQQLVDALGHVPADRLQHRAVLPDAEAQARRALADAARLALPAQPAGEE